MTKHKISKNEKSHKKKERKNSKESKLEKKSSRESEIAPLEQQNAPLSPENVEHSHNSFQTFDFTSPICANFLTGPPSLSDKLSFRAYGRLNSLPDETDRIIVGQGLTQSYRSLNDKPCTGLIGVFDKQTNTIQFHKAVSVDFSHSEIKSKEYMDRYGALLDYVAIRKQESMQDRYVNLRLQYGDNRSKAKVKESVWGLRPTKIIQRERNSYDTSLYHMTPISLSRVNPKGSSFESIFDFYALYPASKKITEVNHNIFSGLSNPPEWLNRYQTYFHELTLDRYQCLTLVLGYVYQLKRCIGKKSVSLRNLLHEDNLVDDEVHIFETLGKNFLQDICITGKNSLERMFGLYIIAALYLSKDMFDSYRVENFSLLCKDIGWDTTKGLNIALVHSIRPHPTIADCIYYNTSAPFKSEYSAAKSKDKSRKILSTNIH